MSLYPLRLYILPIFLFTNFVVFFQINLNRILCIVILMVLYHSNMTNTRKSQECGVCGKNFPKNEIDEVKCYGCWKTEVESLQSRITELEKGNDRGNIENIEKLEGENKKLVNENKEQFDNFQNKIKELENLVKENKVTNTKTNYEEIIRELEEKNKDLTDEIMNMKTESNILEEKYQESVEHNRLFKENLEEMEQCKNMIDEQRKVKKLQATELMNICKDLTEQLNIAKEELENYRANYQKSNKKNTSTDQGNSNSNVKSMSNSVTKSTKDLGAINKIGNNHLNERTKQDETNKNNQRRTQVKRRNRQKIIIIGDSMVTNLNKIVGMNEEGSYRQAIRGAGIKEIISQATEACNDLKRKKTEGVVIIQGGGNSLKALGPDNTIRSIMDGLYQMTKENQYVQVVLSSILPRPRESGHYEEMRNYSNLHLSEQIEYLNESQNKDIIFMNCDPVMYVEYFARDGVHLNYEGNKSLGIRIIKEIRRCTPLKGEVLERRQY